MAVRRSSRRTLANSATPSVDGSDSSEKVKRSPPKKQSSGKSARVTSHGQTKDAQVAVSESGTDPESEAREENFITTSLAVTPSVESSSTRSMLKVDDDGDVDMEPPDSPELIVTNLEPEVEMEPGTETETETETEAEFVVTKIEEAQPSEDSQPLPIPTIALSPTTATKLEESLKANNVPRKSFFYPRYWMLIWAFVSYLVSAEELDHAKDIVLDLLGWGVPPEYLLEYGVSPGAIFKIFTDMNLRLPQSLRVG